MISKNKTVKISEPSPGYVQMHYSSTNGAHSQIFQYLPKSGNSAYSKLTEHRTKTTEKGIGSNRIRPHPPADLEDELHGGWEYMVAARRGGGLGPTRRLHVLRSIPAASHRSGRRPSHRRHDRPETSPSSQHDVAGAGLLPPQSSVLTPYSSLTPPPGLSLYCCSDPSSPPTLTPP